MWEPAINMSALSSAHDQYYNLHQPPLPLPSEPSGVSKVGSPVPERSFCSVTNSEGFFLLSEALEALEAVSKEKYVWTKAAESLTRVPYRRNKLLPRQRTQIQKERPTRGLLRNPWRLPRQTSCPCGTGLSEWRRNSKLQAFPPTQTHLQSLKIAHILLICTPVSSRGAVMPSTTTPSWPCISGPCLWLKTAIDLVESRFR